MNWLRKLLKQVKPVINAEAVFKHSAGATVVHNGPFSDLEIPISENELSQEFLQKWVSPFYMTAINDDFFKENFEKVSQELSEDIVLQLLSDFNWRTRIVGAYFCSIMNYISFEKIIGNLLLRSDVCYAGAGYCYALASFNTEGSRRYLLKYLDYYLKKKKLWFDQSVAMSALSYLDELNSTDDFTDLLPLWKKFVKNKPFWNIKSSIKSFTVTMESIEELRNFTVDDVN